MGSISPCTSRLTLDGLWDPINPGEIKAAKLDLSIAPGPDGLTPRQLRAVPVNVLVRILNLIILCERLLKHRKDSRIIFVPKKPDAVDPAEPSRGHSGQASMVAETTPFFLNPSFAVDMSSENQHTLLT